MLPKKLRLSLRQNPRLFKKNTKRIEGKTLSVLFKPSDFLGFAVVVAKKVSKKAVVRNKIKRQIHDVLQELLPQLRKNLNILVLVKPSIINIDKKQLKEEINKTINLLTI